MIIDSNLVFTDGPIVATSTSDAVALTSLFKPRRMDPIPMSVRVMEDFNTLTSLGIRLTESDTAEGSYSDVPGTAVTIPLADLKAGKKIAWSFLPQNAEKPWLKIAYTVTGSAPSSGKIFAALLREREEPYEAGMYINGGIVKG